MKINILAPRVLVGLCVILAACTSKNPVITVEGGQIQGTVSDGVAVFKGIPYAAPPVGKLRWKAPQPVEPWEGVRVCDTWGAAAMQAPHTSATEQAVNNYGEVDYAKEFYNQDGEPSISEDCLYLNVWKPAKAKAGDSLPVAFWIHGGAFMGGWGYEREFGGEAYAHKDVILVTINYRLGAIGFLAHPALSAENPEGISGNYGMLDQISALKWVHNNIEAFGGDPANVTIFGQSAGAMSVRNLCCSPMTEGLFAKAIIQSGGGLANENRMPVPFMADYEAIGKAIFGDSSLEEMRSMDYDAIQAAFMKYCMENRTWLMLQPCIDGKVLSGDLKATVDAGKLPKIPYMMGCTLDDMAFTRWSEDFPRFAASADSPVYLYEFRRRLPGDMAGAFHSSELWYMFGTLDRCWRPLTEEDYKLSEEMVDAWCNFFKTGNTGWEPGVKKEFDIPGA